MLLGKRALGSHYRVMGNRRLPLLGLVTLLSFACTGGQSGGEELSPSVCVTLETTRALGLDEQTSVGTARELFERGVSLGPRTVALAWYLPDGSLATTHTAVTLGISGEPTSATVRSVPEYPMCPPFITVAGATLGFRSADGAFNESIAGVLSYLNPTELTFSSQQPATNLVGSYDMSAITRRVDHPEFIVDTMLANARGRWDVGSAVSNEELVRVAWWGEVFEEAGGAGGAGGIGGTSGNTCQPIAGEGGSYGGTGGRRGRIRGPNDCEPVCATFVCAENGGCYGVPTGACD